MAKTYRTPLLKGFWSPVDFCMKAFWCPCIISGENHTRIVYGNLQKYDTCNLWCVQWATMACAAPGSSSFLQMCDRMKFEKLYSYKQDTCAAFAVSCFCPCCELIQIKKELDLIHGVPGDGQERPAAYLNQIPPPPPPMSFGSELSTPGRNIVNRSPRIQAPMTPVPMEEMERSALADEGPITPAHTRETENDSPAY